MGHNWPSVARVRDGLVGRGVLVSSRTSDSCGGLGAVYANQGGRVHSVSSGALVRLASGLDVRCVKKQCGLVWLCIGGHMTLNLVWLCIGGHMTLNLRLSGSCSDETRCYNNWIPRNWGEKGVKIKRFKKDLKKKEIAAQINASLSSSKRHISTSTVQRRLRESGHHG